MNFVSLAFSFFFSFPDLPSMYFHLHILLSMESSSRYHATFIFHAIHLQYFDFGHGLHILKHYLAIMISRIPYFTHKHEYHYRTKSLFFSGFTTHHLIYFLLPHISMSLYSLSLVSFFEGRNLLITLISVHFLFDKILTWGLVWKARVICSKQGIHQPVGRYRFKDPSNLDTLLRGDFFLAMENPIELYKFSNKIFV